MAATVSGFLGFAISKVVDQFWTPTSDCEFPEASVETTTALAAIAETAELEQPMKPTTARKNASVRRNTRRKTQATKSVAIALPLDVKPRSYSDPAELASNASTCGVSDDEEEPEVEDIGEKEMRLMLERAEEIKRLTKQSRQPQRQKELRAKTSAAKAKEDVAAVAADYAPIRIQNKTNALWNYSVYSGFAVDTKIANRGPRNMRHLFCTLAETEALEGEEMLLELAAHVLAEN